MGSWSVHCNFSKIAITAGQDCVLQILKNNNTPAILPIYGMYNDYGGIEDIVEDDNTKLIEEHFGCTIKDFCYYFTRKPIDYEEVKDLITKNIEELEDWEMTWIDRKVWDFMSSLSDNYHRNHFSFGKEYILKLLDGEYIGEENDRLDGYKYKWKLFDKYVYSNGLNLKTENGESIYNFTNGYDNLSDYVNIPEKYMWLKDKCVWELWEYFDDEEAEEKLLSYFKSKKTNTGLEKIMKSLGIKKDISPEEILYRRSISYKYLINWRTFATELVKYRFANVNMYAMSSEYKPFVEYLTSQCGERKQHQLLLEKFVEINNSYINWKQKYE